MHFFASLKESFYEEYMKNYCNCSYSVDFHSMLAPVSLLLTIYFTVTINTSYYRVVSLFIHTVLMRKMGQCGHAG